MTSDIHLSELLCRLLLLQSDCFLVSFTIFRNKNSSSPHTAVPVDSSCRHHHLVNYLQVLLPALPAAPVLAPGLFLKTSSPSQLSTGATPCSAASVLATGLFLKTPSPSQLSARAASCPASPILASGLLLKTSLPSQLSTGAAPCPAAQSWHLDSS